MTFEHDDSLECGVNIKVIGVGGGGNNAVNRMIATNIRGVEFVSVNTDRQALRKSEAPSQLVIGEKITKGFGAGANPQIGARAAREMDILTVGIVTKPFAFEGKKRYEQAEAGIAELAQYVDSLIVIPNERLKQVSNNKLTLSNAFGIADDVLRRGVQSISGLINIPSFINLDFADVTSVMANAGYAHMGVGSATGKDKAEEAAKEAISSPLLETSIKGAKGILISISVSPDVGLEEVDLASTLISQEASPDANIIWGVGFDEELEDEMRITIVATGFEKKPEDATRNISNLRPNENSPYRSAKPAAAPAPAEKPVQEKPAQPAVKKVVKPVKKMTPMEEEEDFDDLFGMLKKK